MESIFIYDGRVADEPRPIAPVVSASGKNGFTTTAHSSHFCSTSYTCELYEKISLFALLERMHPKNCNDKFINEKNKQISHLKVSSLHKQRQVAIMLYCGLIQHLKGNALVPCIADMRLSVFAQNIFAVKLYEKLQFHFRREIVRKAPIRPGRGGVGERSTRLGENRQ